MPHVLVWDIETMPDLAGWAAANGHDCKSDNEIRAGRELPKHIYHPIRPIRRFGSERFASFPIILGVGWIQLGAELLEEFFAPSITGTPNQSDTPLRIFLAGFLEGQSERQSWAHN